MWLGSFKNWFGKNETNERIVHGYGSDPREQATPLDIPDPGTEDGCQPADMMLFDLAADPAEQVNLAERNPEVVRRLLRLYAELMADAPSVAIPAVTARKSR